VSLTAGGGLGPQYFPSVVISFDQHQSNKNRRVYENHLRAVTQAEKLVVE